MMKSPIKHVVALAAWGLALVVTVPGQAIAQTAIDELYQRVQQDVEAEATHNDQRLQQFLQRAEEREAMLEEVQSKVASAETRREELQQRFDDNESTLAELEEQLNQRSGNLGELFGVFRQVAGDLEGTLFDSMVNLEHPERGSTIESLAEVEDVPTIRQMRQLWSLMLQEISESGKVSRFEAEVTRPSGQSDTVPVTRVGTFNAVAGDKYLEFSPESQSLVELARQPGGQARDSAAELSSTSDGSQVGFALDPSRGALLGLLVQVPTLMERIQQGRIVGYIILALGVIGLLVVVDRAARLTRTSRRIKQQLNDMEHAREDNPLGRMMLAYYENKHLDDLEVLSKKLDEVTFSDMAELRKGLPTVKVLAAIAPLMGLLGTVTGMISTFQAITLFGTGDPKLMAGGISQALITTVLGLIVAIPLLLSSSFLSSRIQQLGKIIGEQSYGMVARKAVNIAESRNR